MKSLFFTGPCLTLLLVAGLIPISVGCRHSARTIGEYHMGENAVAGPLTYNVVQAELRSQLETSPTPRVPERNFLLIRVTVTNGGGSDVGIPFLKLENSNGETFNESENGTGVDKWLGLLRRISPAQTEDGWLLFDVPTNSYRLRVSDGALENEQAAYISIPLSMQTDTGAAHLP